MKTILRTIALILAPILLGAGVLFFRNQTNGNLPTLEKQDAAPQTFATIPAKAANNNSADIPEDSETADPSFVVESKAPKHPGRSISADILPSPAIEESGIAQNANKYTQNEVYWKSQWEEQQLAFMEKKALLENETDPQERLRLLDSMMKYVRFDTMAALEWAMALEDPDERRAALEAINEKALVGIGAQIELDKEGLPKIKETTVLSAIGATGKVQPGDYIASIINEDGSTIDLHGMPLPDIVKLLRGKPGSTVRLVMERMSEDGGEPVFFNVDVQRSMLVIGNPAE